MSTLGLQLFDEVRPGFFRILAGPSAPVLIDVVSALETALEAAPDGLALDDAVLIAKEVLSARPLLLAEDAAALEAPDKISPSDAPRVAVRRLMDAGWLEKPRRNDFREILFLDPHAKILLGALKRIARPGDTVFTDPLEMVAKALVDPDGFRDNPWGILQACLASVAKGVEELEQMGKAVARLTRHQVQSHSLAENLSRVFEEFSKKFAHGCYRELVRTRLHTRMPELLGRLESLAANEPTTLLMREELLRRQPGLAPTDAAREVRQALDRLRDQLAAIPPLADRVDQHTAEFARRSLARFRYLQEIGAGRREALQAYFEKVRGAATGRRLIDVEDDFGFPPLAIVHARVFAGVDSLFPPRRRRSLTPPRAIDAAATEEETDAALAEIQRNLRDSLGVHRANRYVDSLPGPRGARFTLADLPLRSADDLNDLVSLLLQAGSRDARYRLIVPRVEQNADAPAFLELIGYRIETFEIEKTADSPTSQPHGRRHD